MASAARKASMAAERAIRLRGLEVRYGAKRALAGVDLTITGAQIVGVVGPDGAGKTTLLRTLVGLLDVHAGETRVLGHDLTGDVRALKAEIGYVPQVFSLHRDLSVMENLRFTARLHRLSEAELRRRATPLLERTGLTAFTARPAGALSGGMRQKLGIVNALLIEPALIVLDEPTAGVDVVARDEIWALLAAKRHETMIVLSTSYLDETDACDRLVYMDAGRVVATGTPAELRAMVPVDLYRVWGDRPREIARAARTLPYVEHAHSTGRFARIEVDRGAGRGDGGVDADLRALDPGVRLVERLAIDMEATLLALARRSHGADPARSPAGRTEAAA
jgi:ABC-2 type transport system ATP-binding protein